MDIDNTLERMRQEAARRADETHATHNPNGDNTPMLPQTQQANKLLETQKYKIHTQHLKPIFQDSNH